MQVSSDLIDGVSSPAGLSYALLVATDDLFVSGKSVFLVLEQMIDKEVHSAIHLPIQIGGFQLIVKATKYVSNCIYDTSIGMIQNHLSVIVV